MRFLADQGISPLIVSALVQAGHDAVHVRTLHMSRAVDSDIVERAVADDRIIVTEDTDFGGLVVPTGRTRPSIVLFRDHTGRAAVRIRVLLENLPRLQEALQAGAVVVLDDWSVRVRLLREVGEET